VVPATPAQLSPGLVREITKQYVIGWRGKQRKRDELHDVIHGLE